MSNEKQNGPARARTRRDEGKCLGRELRAMYAEIIAEGVPERFAEILRRLDDPKNKGGDSMTLILRKQNAHDRIEGQEPPHDWSDDDYAVVDERLVGRIYRQQVQGDIKWLWFLQTVPAPLPNQGIADTLEEAKVALAARYEQVKRGE
jgi:hypothetical protein